MRFYFDFISPYAYLAWTQIHALAARHGQSVEPVPILFAALLNAHGQKGPAEIPAKRAYLARDVCRKAHHLGLPPVVPPPSHPFNPLPALRAACFPLAVDARRRLIDALFAATWAGGGGVETEDAIGAACARAGLAPPPVLEFARSEAGKAALRQCTDAALAAGLFGVPTVEVDGELFWGTDALPTLEDHLSGARPLSPELMQRWQALKPSASRLR